MSFNIVSDAELKEIVKLSQSSVHLGLSYGTVRDFCQGADCCPNLCSYNDDLKDAQRFWALKTILATQQKGATLLEIGAGEPVVADILGRLGYRVIVVDPYEGAGNGPTALNHFKQVYQNVEYIVDWFSPDLKSIEPSSIHCCYSISVIEHISPHLFEAIVKGMEFFTRPSGLTVHAIDFVAAGPGTDYHSNMFKTFVGLLGYNVEDAASVILKAAEDVDTYYLSAEAHNRWRGETPYDEFPMRRVQSMQVVGWPRTLGRQTRL